MPQVGTFWGKEEEGRRSAPRGCSKQVRGRAVDSPGGRYDDDDNDSHHAEDQQEGADDVQDLGTVAMLAGTLQVPQYFAVTGLWGQMEGSLGGDLAGGPDWGWLQRGAGTSRTHGWAGSGRRRRH